MSTFIITFAITIIQLFTSSTTNSIDALINIRFFHLKTEFVTRNHYDSQRSINHIYNHKIIMISIIPISEQRANNPIYVNLKTFIDEMKENVISHNRKILKDAKIKLLNKHYKSHHI